MGRILAVDLGERRIGLALSDPLGLTAQGLPTAARRNKREDLNFVESLVRRHDVSRVLIGHPLNMDGSEGPQARKARAFAEALSKRVSSSVTVELWDERLTSVEAEVMLDPSTMGESRRRGRVDQLAATILLQSYLDTHRTGTAVGEAGA